MEDVYELLRLNVPRPIFISPINCNISVLVTFHNGLRIIYQTFTNNLSIICKFIYSRNTPSQENKNDFILIIQSFQIEIKPFNFVLILVCFLGTNVTYKIYNKKCMSLIFTDLRIQYKFSSIRSFHKTKLVYILYSNKYIKLIFNLIIEIK